ncbi:MULTISPECIES: hypothetical protein [unclassified Streptomyces]|uniref:hypothetical protein n=1 Tax=unclassified Streptomyces TaxID=2593676 RepID=UPI002E12FBC7|nr:MULTISPECIES: hypothetical protein [unclassified Streptomyces]WSQ76912.1 hypothetical protein OG725_07335 [Streptomyces sp. NBC_01213]WSQ84240.1 hypothetical protein OG722_07765 [Streptomyces sp. NBC_01212]WSR09703.1 hypothetical protein OG265_28400 [Streptomyces sp. NBC_01208]
MTRGPSPHTVNRSPDGGGITARDEARCGLHVTGTGRGLPDEVPDEPRHLSLNADRVFREGEVPGAQERSHAMPCGRG